MRHNLRFYGGKCCFSLVNLGKLTELQRNYLLISFLYIPRLAKLGKSHKSLIIKVRQYKNIVFFLYFSGYFRILRVEYISPPQSPQNSQSVFFCFSYTFSFFITYVFSFFSLLFPSIFSFFTRGEYSLTSAPNGRKPRWLLYLLRLIHPFYGKSVYPRSVNSSSLSCRRQFTTYLSL
jgi:hypothetical protein